LQSKEERTALLQKVLSEIYDPQKFLSGWFRGGKIEEIGREDLKEFLSWVFWEGRAREEDEEQLQELMRKMEQ